MTDEEYRDLVISNQLRLSKMLDQMERFYEKEEQIQENILKAQSKAKSSE